MIGGKHGNAQLNEAFEMNPNERGLWNKQMNTTIWSSIPTRDGNADVGIRGLSGFRLSEFVQISEFLIFT